MPERNRIKPRRSYVPGSVPLPGDLEPNEVCVNWNDAVVFCKSASGHILSFPLRIPTASATTVGGIRVGSGLTISDGVLSTTGGSGGSASISYAYATTADLPATGNADLLYCTTDTGRLYRWTGSVYAEVGPVGGGGGSGGGVDTEFRSLFLPPAPTNVTGIAGNAQVALTWTAPTVLAQTPITDYQVQFQPSGGAWQPFSDGTSTAASATVTGLTNGTAYTFRVRAVNGVGEGAWSTASSSVTPVAGDPFYSSVSLLLHMDGTGSTFTDNSPSPKTVTANGNATQSTAQSKWGGKSASFDGSGDYLAVPSIVIGTSDFVMECWLYLSSITGAYTGIYDARDSQGAQPTLLLNGSNIAWFTNAAFRITGSTLSTGQWYHIAVARASGSTRMYVNGSQSGSTYSDSTSYTSSSAPRIGALFDGYGLAGFIDDFRLTVGSARGYTGSTITVPTAAFPDVGPPGTDPLFPSVSLLLHMDGTGSTFTDNSPSPKTITAVGDVTQSTAQSKWGGKSARSDGNGDYVTFPASVFNFTGDFTIEWWQYIDAASIGTGNGQQQGLFGNGRSAGVASGMACYIQAAGGGSQNRIQLDALMSGSWTSPLLSANTSFAGQTWQHVAITRSGSEWSMYLDGTRVATATNSGSLSWPNSQPGSLLSSAGNGEFTSSGVTTYIDDFRVTHAARYTGSTITVPTAAFPDA